MADVYCESWRVMFTLQFLQLVGKFKKPLQDGAITQVRYCNKC